MQLRDYMTPRDRLRLIGEFKIKHPRGWGFITKVAIVALILLTMSIN